MMLIVDCITVKDVPSVREFLTNVPQTPLRHIAYIVEPGQSVPEAWPLLVYQGDTITERSVFTLTNPDDPRPIFEQMLNDINIQLFGMDRKSEPKTKFLNNKRHRAVLWTGNPEWHAAAAEFHLTVTSQNTRRILRLEVACG